MVDVAERRKFLVVIDDTEECERALYFAMRCASRQCCRLVLLYVIVPANFQHWINVESLIREDAREKAYDILHRFSAIVREESAIEAELVVKEGSRARQVVELIAEDKEIGTLLLASAAKGAEGPGPLVMSLVSERDEPLPVLITLVPGNLNDEGIDMLV